MLMERMKTALLLPGVLVVALAMGCGGGDGGSSATSADKSAEASSTATAPESASESQTQEGGTPLTRASFVAQSNAACKKRAVNIQTKGSKYFVKYGGPGEERKFGEVVVRKVIVPEFEGEIQDLRDLTPPAGTKKQVDALVASIDRFLRLIEENPAAKNSYPYHEAEHLAAKAGIAECGHP